MFLLIFLACTYLTYGQCKLTKNESVHLLSFCFLACVHEIELFETLF